MIFEFIKNLEDVKWGTTYYKDDTGKIEIDCFENCIRITDFDNLTLYYKKILDIPTTVFKNILEKHQIKNINSLINALNKEDFKIDTFEKKEFFNPFIKEISGKLNIKIFKKSKCRSLTKAQVKKILTHKDTEVNIYSAYTDDYAYDYAMNYFKDVKISRLGALYDVTKYFNCAFVEDDNTITLIVVGHSKTLILKNKNLKFIENKEG